MGYTKAKNYNVNRLRFHDYPWKTIDMSVVTDLILVTSPGESRGIEPNHGLIILNNYLSQNHPGCKFESVADSAGGNKAMQRDIYLAAINHLNVLEFIKVYKDSYWFWPEAVVLLLGTEDDDVPQIHLRVASTENELNAKKLITQLVNLAIMLGENRAKYGHENSSVEYYQKHLDKSVAELNHILDLFFTPYQIGD